MEIVYCSSCGFRIKDADFAEGRAARIDDKPYCQKCRPALSVLPPARKSPGTGIVGVAPHRSSIAGHVPYQSAHAHAHPRDSSHRDSSHDTGFRTREAPSRLAEPSRPAEYKSLAPIAAGVGVALLAGAALLFSGGSSKPSKPVADKIAEKEPDRQRVTSPETRTEPRSFQSSNSGSAVQNRKASVANPTQPESEPERPLPRTNVLSEDAQEAAARDAFDAIVNSGTETDKLGRVAQWENFLERYGNTIVASRARTLLEALQREIASDKPPKTMEQLPTPGFMQPTPADDGKGIAVAPNGAPPGAGDAKPVPLPDKPGPAPAPVVNTSVKLDAFDARLAYVAYQDDVLSTVRKLNASALNTRLAKAEADAALKPLNEDVSADGKKLAAMMADFDAAVLRGAAKLKDEDDLELRINKGAPIRVGKKAPFQLVDMKDNTLNLTSRGMTMPLSLDSLHLDSRKRLAAMDLTVDGASYMRRIFMELLDAGPRPMGQARIYLEKAKAGGIAAEDLAVAQRWIEACEEDVRERSAKVAFAELVKMGDEQALGSLQAGLKKFKEAYGRTAFATKKTAELKKLTAMTDVPGLLGRYFKHVENKHEFMEIAADAKHDFLRADAQINFASVGGDWHGTGMAYLQAQWTGSIQIEKAGIHAFYLESDDGSRMFIDGKLVVDNGGGHPMQERGGSADLSEGRHEVRIDYFNAAGGGGCILRWQPPGGTKDVVPGRVLFHPSLD